MTQCRHEPSWHYRVMLCWMRYDDHIRPLRAAALRPARRIFSQHLVEERNGTDSRFVCALNCRPSPNISPGERRPPSGGQVDGRTRTRSSPSGVEAITDAFPGAFDYECAETGEPQRAELARPGIRRRPRKNDVNGDGNSRRRSR